MEGSDHELMRAVGEGDPQAFERLVRRYQGSVFSFIIRHLGDRPTAEDLTQEVFLRVYRAAPGFEPRGKVQTWILTIAYNLCLNERKRLRRFKLLQDDLSARREGESTAPIDSFGWEEEIAKALCQLPEKQRAAILLRVNEGLSYVEIGKVLAVSRASVESLIFRARTHLREVLKPRTE